MSPLAVNVVVTCSNKKTVPDAVALRDVPAGAIPDRARIWIRGLESDGVRVPAHELYAGENWSVVKSLRGVADQNGVSLSAWICSAGYGLVSWRSPLRSYAATFAGAHADSVARATAGTSGRLEREQWWGALSIWPGPREGDPRTFVDLVKQNPAIPLVVAVSPHYLQAVANDLKQARHHMGQDGRLIVLTCDAGLAREFPDASVLCDSRLQTVVHGPRNSLTVRVFRLLLSRVRDIGIAARTWRDHVAELAERQPPIARYDRAKMTDVEIRRFIGEQLVSDTGASHSVLLRRLRDGGSACEQKRFRDAYLTVIGERTA